MKCSKQHRKTKFPTLMFHQESRYDFAPIRNLGALRCARNSSMFVTYLSKIDISLARLITQCACFIIALSSLLPPIRRNVQHHDRTRHGDSSLRSLRMSCFESCILFLGMHSSSGSRTQFTTWIRGLNHGWNRTFIISSIFFTRHSFNEDEKSWSGWYTCNRLCGFVLVSSCDQHSP